MLYREIIAVCSQIYTKHIYTEVQLLNVNLAVHHWSLRILILIYLLTAIGLSSGGSTHLHTNST